MYDVFINTPSANHSEVIARPSKGIAPEVKAIVKDMANAGTKPTMILSTLRTNHPGIPSERIPKRETISAYKQVVAREDQKDFAVTNHRDLLLFIREYHVTTNKHIRGTFTYFLFVG